MTEDTIDKISCADSDVDSLESYTTTTDEIELFTEDNELFGNNSFTVYNCNARHFANLIKCWKYQRDIRRDHVEIIVESLREDLCLHGDFIVCKLDGEYYLVDGQHRKEAILEITDADDSINFEILVKVYEVDGEGEILKIFKKSQ